MSCVSFLPVYVSGVSLILLLAAGSEAQDYNFTPSPDYDIDYNATFDYSFYSNASNEALEKFSERFLDQEEEQVTVSTSTTGVVTERGRNAASLTASLVRTSNSLKQRQPS
uniref:Uncharacterized protein n=1 Tax=Mastacembelus armatus TaxID=205130 RepID=A0A3Q3SYL8_9TELE